MIRDYWQIKYRSYQIKQLYNTLLRLMMFILLKDHFGSIKSNMNE